MQYSGPKVTHTVSVHNLLELVTWPQPVIMVGKDNPTPTVWKLEPWKCLKNTLTAPTRVSLMTTSMKSHRCFVSILCDSSIHEWQGTSYYFLTQKWSLSHSSAGGRTKRHVARCGRTVFSERITDHSVKGAWTMGWSCGKKYTEPDLMPYTQQILNGLGGGFFEEKKPHKHTRKKYRQILVQF